MFVSCGIRGPGILVVLDFCPWKETKMQMRQFELLTKLSGMGVLSLWRNRNPAELWMGAWLLLESLLVLRGILVRFVIIVTGIKFCHTIY